MLFYYMSVLEANRVHQGVGACARGERVRILLMCCNFNQPIRIEYLPSTSISLYGIAQNNDC